MGLTRGNRKLGKSIHHFSIPADEKICRTATKLCASLCYAKRGTFHHANVKKSLADNYQVSLRPGFVSHIIAAARTDVASIVRIHASGEFYSAKYIRDWINITRRLPQTLFFGYTRSYRDQSLIPALTALAARPNVRLWLSADAETGPPPEIPFTRHCYLQTDYTDLPQFPVDLVFRSKRKKVAKKVAGVLVCPVENGVTKTTCTTCKLCFRAQHHLDRINDFTQSVSSPLAVIDG